LFENYRLYKDVKIPRERDNVVMVIVVSDDVKEDEIVSKLYQYAEEGKLFWFVGFKTPKVAHKLPGELINWYIDKEGKFHGLLSNSTVEEMYEFERDKCRSFL